MKLFTMLEVSEILSIHHNTVKHLVKQGALRSIRVTPKRIRISEADLQDYLANNVQGGNDA